jgi:polyhydroxyalkanoate synthesis repressor PhaR
MAKKKKTDGVVIIKKYANRRLYDTSSSSYVTLDHLSDLVRAERDFEVRDAKSGEDLTRQVLTQIIFEQETKGEGALPLNFLRQLIGFYGRGAQAVLPAWLDMSMDSFSKSQKEWRQSTNPLSMFEKQAKRNMKIFESAMKMFLNPLGMNRKEDSATKAMNGALDLQTQSMAMLQAQMAALQEQIEVLSKKN